MIGKKITVRGFKGVLEVLDVINQEKKISSGDDIVYVVITCYLCKEVDSSTTYVIYPRFITTVEE